MARFASTTDLGNYLAETLSGARLTQAGLLLDLASSLIQGWTRQRIEYVANDVVTLAGSYDWALELPERPVVAVDAITVDGVTVASTAYRLEGSTLIHKVSGWTGPASVVQVTYDHGYSTIPDDIRAATLALTARMMANPSSVRQEGIGTYSVSYGDDPNVDAVLEPLIGRYRQRTASVPLWRNDRINYPIANS